MISSYLKFKNQNTNHIFVIEFSFGFLQLQSNLMSCYQVRIRTSWIQFPLHLSENQTKNILDLHFLCFPNFMILTTLLSILLARFLNPEKVVV